MAENQNSGKGSFNPNQHASAQTEKQDQSKESSENSEPSDEILKQIQELQAAADKYRNEFLYLRADFDNFKKNSLKERSEYLKYGNERLIVEILGVLDNFERALETKINSENINTLVKGVEMTAVDLRNILQKYGVSEVPSKGQPFDPNIHEALSSEESNEPAGSIVRVFKKPYRLHDKIIRPGQVVVAKPVSQ